MGKRTKKRRQSHGSAWLWKQTDFWYYTRPGTRQRVALFNEHGERIRGKENKEAAEIALAREKLTWEQDRPGACVRMSLLALGDHRQAHKDE